MVDLTKKIMRRVYLIWFVRQIFNPVTVKAVVVVLLVRQVAVYVSVRDIIANWHPAEWGFSGNYTFLQSAFTQTDLMVQILTLGIVTVAALLARDVIMRKWFTGIGRVFIRV
ncbi:MAG: hypothetical protein Q8R36_05445 [bacterium]|nr:hypothetical protein [bacterium]